MILNGDNSFEAVSRRTSKKSYINIIDLTTWVGPIQERYKSLLDIHIDECIMYCEAIHTSSPGLKDLVPVHISMIHLITK